MDLCYKRHSTTRINQPAERWFGPSFSSWLDIQSYFDNLMKSALWIKAPGMVVCLSSICDATICNINCGFKGGLSGTWYLLGKFCVQRIFHLHSSKGKKKKKIRFFMFCIRVISMFFADFWWTLVETLM